MASEKTETHSKEKMRVGVKIVKQLSQTFYGNNRMVFDELVTNAFDAMAENVRIYISPEEVIVEDDGQGMSHEEAVKFFYIAHADKLSGTLVNMKGMKRKIIGKFGIGKIAMYQICRRFQITTWKDGYESDAEFSFDELEKKAFIDEVELDVRTRKTDDTKTGTRIVMKDLVKKINPVMIRRGLGKTMPINPRFNISINDLPLQPFKLGEAKEREIDDNVEGVGRVTGKIFYLKNPLFTLHHKEGNIPGIYVRVYGRVINADDPAIIDLSLTVGANVFSRRIVAILDVDDLDGAILSNRSGFIKDDPKYIAFLAWIRRKINRLNMEEMKTSSEERQIQEDKVITEEVLPAVRIAVDTISKHPGKMTKTMQHTRRSSSQVSKRFDDESKTFILGNTTYTMKAQELGEDASEAKLDKKLGLLIINKSHPMFKLAESMGCQDFHSLKASIFIIAYNMSKNMGAFKRIYDKLEKRAAIQ